MPSMFEPGGIVQHEFFVGGTPVVAFKTGGLKDSVIEFQWISETGCGFTFEAFNKDDLAAAIHRAIGTFQNKQKYAKIRENAFRATMSGEIVTKAWLAEFYRLRGKVYFDFDRYDEAYNSLGTWDVQNHQPLNVIDEIFGKEVR